MSRKKIGLLLAAAAAYGIYRYSKLTPEQKNGLVAKGKNLLRRNGGKVSDALDKAKVTVAESGY